MKKRNKILDYISYLLLRFIVGLFHLFSLDMNLRTAKFLGKLMWLAISSDYPLINKILRRRHKDQMLTNLRIAFKDTPDEELLRIAELSCKHLVMFAMECLFTTRLISLSTWRRYIVLKNFDEALKVLLQDRSVILITGHYGSWEVLGYTLAILGFDIVAVMRPLDNPYMNNYLLRIRERHGLRLLYKRGATRSIDDYIRAGSAIGFIADQDAGKKGLFVDFFGKRASTYKSIGLIAIEYKLPIIVGCARRISWDSFKYEIEAEDIIYPEDWQGKDNELLYITERYTKAIERMVRKDPSQYLWLHRRWKTRPPDELANNP